jgi:hypothetical protein
MRELEMRQRVERFLQSRLAKMLMPATLGLGLAVGGCGSNTLEAGQDSAVVLEAGSADGPSADKQIPPDAKLNDLGPEHDAGSINVKYMAQMPDAASDIGGAIALYMAPAPDSGAVMRYMAPQPVDAGNADRAVALYMAPTPDSGAVMRYMAPQPVDASAERGVVALYMAQLPISRS